ncbi:hypothetical protein THASP1DRAFT_28539, partial [Thamnocephalis sphaerospora]
MVRCIFVAAFYVAALALTNTIVTDGARLAPHQPSTVPLKSGYAALSRRNGASASSRAQKNNHPGVLPTAYILQLTASPSTAEARSQRSFILKWVHRFLNVSDVHEFDTLMNGVSFDVSGGGERLMAEVASHAMVKRAWPVTAAATHSSALHPAGSRMFNATATHQPHRWARRASTTDPNGAKIGIIDTGIDYKHPSLGGCFGPGCIVAYGYDFVGDAYNGKNVPQPDADPMDECNGHGTH